MSALAVFEEFSNRLREDRPVRRQESLPWGRWVPIDADRLCALFAILHTAPLAPVAITRWVGHYNWGTDRLWCAPGGVGLLVAQENFGGLPGDGIDTHAHYLLPDDIHLSFTIGEDYTQTTLSPVVEGHADAPVATVLEAAAAVLRGWRAEVGR